MSKLVKIISLKSTKKIISHGVPRVRFSEYANNLGEQAKNHPGFISSSSYWKNTINFPNDEETCKLEIVSISNWKSIDDWNNWFNSQKRQKIRNSYDDIIENETFNLLNKRTIKDDTFLL